jgi:prepilin-type N-terminal cleavage/methylation domain-containing protein
MNRIKGGFSLVEMIIAIAIVGLLSIPLLLYFSRSAVNSSTGRMVQVGEMAAGSVIEEIKSYDTFDQLSYAVEEAVSGCAFTADSGAPVGDGRQYFLRDITVNDIPMTAKIRIDFDYETDPSEMLYNDYEVPELNALYTDQNVVAVEDDESELAVNEFYYMNTGSISKANIRNNMTRSGNIHVETNAANEDLLNVSITFVYQHAADTPVSFVITNTEILKEDFRNIYFLYDLLSESVGEDEINVSFSGDITQDEAKEYGIYLICQTPVGFDYPPGYSIGITPSGGNASYAKYYANAREDGTEIPIHGSVTTGYYIQKEAKNRIGNITVDIYYRGETVFTEDTRIVQMKAAK